MTASVTLLIALDAEMSEHLGYEKHDPAGRNSGNSRNGTRSTTVLTEIGPVEIEVPRDTESTFEPQIVKKRQRRLTGPPGGDHDDLVARDSPSLCSPST
jgi:transposase-like protein